MQHSSDSKADLRAWLYRLLAQLELTDIEEASRTELNSTHIIIDIQFKVSS